MKLGDEETTTWKLNNTIDTKYFRISKVSSQIVSPKLSNFISCSFVSTCTIRFVLCWYTISTKNYTVNLKGLCWAPIVVIVGFSKWWPCQ